MSIYNRRFHFFNNPLISNTGDYYGLVMDYVPELHKRGLCIRQHFAKPRYKLLLPNDIVFFGGGGIFDLIPRYNKHIVELIEYCRSNNIMVISWGAGVHSYNLKKVLPEINFDMFELVGLRDYNYTLSKSDKIEYVPCPTCMSMLLDKEYPIEREIGIALHFQRNFNSINELSAKYDTIRMIGSMSQMLDFIGSCEAVLTNSYHAALWAQLLGRRVVLANPDWTVKFKYMRHVPETYTGDLLNDINKAKIHEGFLDESRSISYDFKKRVIDLVDMTDEKIIRKQEEIMNVTENLKQQIEEIKTIFENTAVDFDTYRLFLKKIKDDNDIYIYIHFVGDNKKFPVRIKPLLLLSNYEEGKIYSQNKPGLNIVVYDAVNDELIDSVCFDLVSGIVWRNGNVISQTAGYTRIDMRIREISAMKNECKQQNNLLADKFFKISDKNGIEYKRAFHMSIPKAKDISRMKQLILLYEMTVFDQVCKRLEVPYTLCGGTLLGAWRNRGFIPWDDDVDLITLTDGLEKLLAYCYSDKQFSDLPRWNVYTPLRHAPGVFSTKFHIHDIHTNFFIDVFPYTFSKGGAKEDVTSMKRHKKQYAEKIKSYYDKGTDKLNLYDLATQYFKEISLKFNLDNSKEYLLGSLTFHNVPMLAYPVHKCLPLSKISFEGIDFPAPQDIDAILEMRYGNYWKLPLDKSLRSHGKINLKIVEQAVNFIRENDFDFYQKYIYKEWEDYNASK